MKKIRDFFTVTCVLFVIVALLIGVSEWGARQVNSYLKGLS